jgi:formylmethanofuran dehydrogenase subunit E
LRIVTTPKDRVWSDELYARAEEFHGHGGPFMVIGLRMGQTALEALDARGWFGLRCKAMLRWKPPDSCVLDGIQMSSGCTTGKHNLDVVERDGVAAEFTTGEKTVRIVLKGRVLEEIREELAEDEHDEDHGEEPEELIERLKTTSIDELFIVEAQAAHRG